MAFPVKKLGGENLRTLFPTLIGESTKVSYYPGWKSVLVNACSSLAKTGVELFDINCKRGRLNLVPCECKHLRLGEKNAIRKVITQVLLETSKMCIACGGERKTLSLLFCERCADKAKLS